MAFYTPTTFTFTLNKSHPITRSTTPNYPITSCLPKNHPQNSPFLPLLPSTHKKNSNFTVKNDVKLFFGSVILVGNKKVSNFFTKNAVNSPFLPILPSTHKKDSNFTVKKDVKLILGSVILMGHKKVSNFFTKNAVKIILGSVILMGSLNSRYTLASPMQKTQQESVILENDEEMYVKLLEKEPRNLDALKVVVNLKMRKGLTKEALKYVEMLIKIEPKQVEWRLLEALCYEMMGQFGKAKKLFKDVLKQQPLLLRALHGLAMVKHKNHEGPAVFDMLNQALELAQREKRVTEERNIKILIAQMHLVQGNLDEASKKYQELITENPRDFRPYLCQGIIYSLQEKKKEADEQFEIYRSLVPEEFPQRGFLEDVVLAAKTESREQLEKEFKAQFPSKR